VHSQAFDVDGRIIYFYSNKSEYLIENILTYNKDINEKSDIDFTFLQSTNKRSYTSDLLKATGFTNDVLSYNSIGSAKINYPVIHESWDRQLLSYMGRARLNLANKYLITVTGRLDGSSVFASNRKWGFFPSAAAGWKVHKEPFMQSQTIINELKLRTSYGSIGNEAIKPYQTQYTSEEHNYAFGNETEVGYLPGSTLYNPDLIWETSTSFNLGIDYGIANNLFVGNVEVYNTKTTDLLIQRSLSGISGYKYIIDNIGEVQNQGIELNLTTNVLKRENYDGDIILNFSRNRNKILDLFGEVDRFGNKLNDLAGKRFIGEPIDVIYDYQFDGIWQEYDDIENSYEPLALPGQIRVADINNDSLINENDKVVITKDPKWIGSVAAKLRIYQFTLYADLYIVHGAKKLNPFLYSYNHGGSMQGILNGIKIDYYTPENPSTEHPRPMRSKQVSYLTAYAVKDASYVRLRTLSLSYQVPENMIKRLKMTDFSIYSTFSNPFTWTKYLSYSPENNAGQYPDSKSFIIGVKMTL
jgi:TonB-linked SusC/RagA family outer membrane protein